jgi:tripartite-type tricarboxylate transporter receptor subunit TctC
MDRRLFLCAGSSLSLAPLGVWANEPFPNRPVKVISPFAAGGGPDVQLRQFVPYLSDIINQPVVVENKVGAAGVLAANFVAGAAADGYTVLLGSNTHLIQKLLRPSLRFDPLTDFAAVSNLSSSPTIMVVSADSPWKRIEEVAAAGKSAVNSMNYGSGGIGTSAHLAGATFASLQGMRVTHIPLRGSVEITASLLRGDTQYAFPVAGTAIPQIKGGRLRALATTSAKRLSALPEVPTLNELMNNELTVQESWFGLWVPANTSVDVIKRLHETSVKAMANADLHRAFEAVGNTVSPSSSPSEFRDFIQRENNKWAEIVRLSGATSS